MISIETWFMKINTDVCQLPKYPHHIIDINRQETQVGDECMSVEMFIGLFALLRRFFSFKKAFYSILSNAYTLDP